MVFDFLMLVVCFGGCWWGWWVGGVKTVGGACGGGGGGTKIQVDPHPNQTLLDAWSGTSVRIVNTN